MSNNQQSSFGGSISGNFSSSSYSYSSSSYSSKSGGRVEDRQAQSQQTYSDSTGNKWSSSTASDNTGTMIRDEHRDPSGETRSSTTRYGPDGRPALDDGGQGARGQIEDVTDRDQAARDREYEERIEDEYAKREGGA
jgi:hypothetical protein